MAQARFTLVGRVTLVNEDEQPAVREAFLGANPDSFWVRPCSHHRSFDAAGPALPCQTLLTASFTALTTAGWSRRFMHATYVETRGDARALNLQPCNAAGGLRGLLLVPHGRHSRGPFQWRLCPRCYCALRSPPPPPGAAICAVPRPCSVCRDTRASAAASGIVATDCAFRLPSQKGCALTGTDWLTTRVGFVGVSGGVPQCPDRSGRRIFGAHRRPHERRSCHLKRCYGGPRLPAACLCSLK